MNLQLIPYLLVKKMNAFLYFRNKAKMLAFMSSIQHCAGNPSQCNKARKGNKTCKDWKGRGKTTFICRSYRILKTITKLMREFDIFAGYKVDTQKLIIFLYINSKQLENGNFKSLFIVT